MDKIQGLVLIQIKGAFINFNQQLTLPLSHSNFPTENSSFRKGKPGLWLCKMTGYIQGKLQLQVLEYDSDQSDIFEQQSPKKQISEIIFSELDWHKLKDQMCYYRKSDFDNITSDQGGDLAVHNP